MSSTPTLQLAPPARSTKIPTCTPNLMPFHINHTGPAPVGTYFRVKRAERRTPGTPGTAETQEQEQTQEPPQTQSQTETSELGLDTAAAAASAAATDGAVEAGAMAVDGAPPAVLVDAADLPASASQGTTSAATQNTETEIVAAEDGAARFVATFRGRVVQGLTVGVPAGFGGLVLRGEGAAGSVEAVQKEEDEGKGKKGRGGRTKKGPGKTKTDAKKGRRAAALDVDEGASEGDGDVHMDLDGDAAAEAEEADGTDEHVRMLVPSAVFSSFVLWSPDIPVDDGKDEYLRGLTEWAALAAEIHRV